MKKVLWVSRHEMTDAQFADLERGMGDRVELICQKDTIRNAKELLPQIQLADAVAVVLPLHLLPEVLSLAGGKPVLQAVAERVLADTEHTLEDGRKEKGVRFIHKHWEQVLKVEIETRICGG